MPSSDIQTTMNTDQQALKEFDLIVDEYKLTCNQITKRVSFQQSILNYQIVLIGIILAAGAEILKDGHFPEHVQLLRFFLLLSPLPFYFLSWSFSNHDIMIVALARYVNLHLRTRLKKLIGDRDVLQFEDFLNKERSVRFKHFGLLPTIGEEFFFPLIMPIVLNLIYLIILAHLRFEQQVSGASPVVLEISLLFLNVVFLFVTIHLRWKVSKYYLRITKDGTVE
jgi:hypothetical protein